MAGPLDFNFDTAVRNPEIVVVDGLHGRRSQRAPGRNIKGGAVPGARNFEAANLAFA